MTPNFSFAKSKSNLLLIVLLVLLLFIRAYRYPSWLGFDYDQEINAKIAKEIVVDHKLTLIGPETSVGGMYVGPFYNYLIALFFFLGHMNPESVIPLNLLVSLGTGIFCYLLGKEISGRKETGLFAVIVYGFSQTLIEFDRVSWNPTPIVLATLGLFYFILRYLKERKLWQITLAAVLVGFSLQLHFAAIFLLIFFLFSLILFGKKVFFSNWITLLVVSAVLILFVSPLILFDLRHSFLNSRHLFQFITLANKGQRPLASDFFSLPLIFIEFLRAIFIKQSHWANNIAAGVLLLYFLVTNTLSLIKRPTAGSRLALLFFGIFLLGLSFYHGPLPSYYFLPVLGLYVILSADFLSLVWSQGTLAKAAVTLSLLSFILVNLPPVLGSESGLSLKHKREAVNFIVADAAGQSFRVEFITGPGARTGFHYLFWLAGKDLIEDTTVATAKVYKIVIPYFLVSSREISATFGGIGVIKR